MRLRYQVPLDLPLLSTVSLPEGTRAGICIEPPGVPRTMLRRAPEFIDDPAGLHLFDHIGAQTYKDGPAFVTVVRQATLFGYRSLAWDGSFCNDEGGKDHEATQRVLDGLGSADPFPNEDTELRRAPAGDGRDFDFDTPVHRHIDRPAVVLCSQEPSNYASFLFRVLPKLHAVRSHGLGHLPIVVWGNTQSFIDLLGLCGIHEQQIIRHDTHRPVSMDLAIAPSLRNPHGFLDRQSMELFRQLTFRHAGLGNRRLYISRIGQTNSDSASRKMLNEPEVAAALVRLGFEVIEPGTMPVFEQIATFASADIVVGPSGSGMFNCVFCRPGTKVIDIESEPHWIWTHTGLLSSVGARYGIFVGAVDPTDPRKVHRRFTVDIDALAKRVTDFMQR